MSKGSKNSNWEPCPRCGSSKIHSAAITFIALGIASISIGFFVGLFLFPAFLLIPLGFLSFVMAPFMGKMKQCKDCNYTWKPGEENKLKSKNNN